MAINAWLDAKQLDYRLSPPPDELSDGPGRPWLRYVSDTFGPSFLKAVWCGGRRFAVGSEPRSRFARPASVL